MTEPHPDTEQTPRRKAAMRPWVFWVRALFVLCLLPLVFVAAAAVMMIDREINAPSWIIDRIEARADDVLAGATLEFGAITVRIGRDLHPTVRLVDTRLVDADGLTISRVPVVEGLMSPRGLILQQDVLMQQVRLIGARINLRRAANGEVSFAFAAGGSAVRQARSLPELLDNFDQIFDRPAFEALEMVTADGVIVNYDDARARRSWVVDGSRIALDLRDNETAISGNFALLTGRAEVTNVNLSYTSPRGSRVAQIGLNLTNALASDIASQSPALNWLRDVDAPITAAMRTSLDRDGALGPLNASLEIGQGAFQPNPGTPAVTFDDAKAYFTYDPVRDSISFSEVSLQTEWGQLRAEGRAFLREFDDGLPRALLAQFELSDVAVSPPGLFVDPPQVNRVAVDLRARFDPFKVEIGQIVISDGESLITGAGDIAATDAGWDIAIDAEMDKVTPERVIAFWPEGLKPRTRTWVQNNLADGSLTNIVAGFRAAPQQPARFAMGSEFEEMSVKFLRNLPPIQAARGVFSIENNALVVSVDEGTVLAPQGGPLQVAGSDLTIADLRLNPSPAILNLQVDSSVTAALSLLNQEPFLFMDKANIPVTVADGRARTSGRIAWPLRPRPPRETIKIDMAAQLRGVRSNRLLPGRQLASPSLDVTVTDAGVNIAGPVRVGDVTAVGAWDQRFNDPDLPGSRVVAAVDLSQTFLDEFGITLPPGTISGDGTGELIVSFRRDAPPAFLMTSDLRGLRVALPVVGWAKGPRTAGNLRLQGTLGAVPQIDTLSISGGGLQATGRIDLTPQGQLDRARFSRVRIGNWLDAPITLRGRGQGQAVGVEIAGGTLDLRGAQFGGGGATTARGGPLRINLDRLQIAEGIALSNFAGNFRGDGGFRGEFSGLLNGAASVNGAVAPRNGRSAVRLRSDDAGNVLRAAGLMQSAVGGVLDLTLLPTGGAGTFEGRLSVRSIRVRDAPAIAALLDAISVVGLLQQLDGQGLAFDEVDATFRLTPAQVIVSEASAIGPGLGISIDGIYTLANKGIDMQGVVSPFFLVNSIGSFLTRRGEGLVGFNFNISGTAAAPQVAVNPLSLFTPGMFREIFRRPAPDISQ